MFWEKSPKNKNKVHPMFTRPARKGVNRNRQRVDIISLKIGAGLMSHTVSHIFKQANDINALAVSVSPFF
jgi:hypothetical protein